MKCSPALDMVYPELCSCIYLGSCGEMQAVLQLFSIGCGFTISLSKTALPPRLTIPTPLVALLLSLNLVLSHWAAETSSIISIPFIVLYFGRYFFPPLDSPRAGSRWSSHAQLLPPPLIEQSCDADTANLQYPHPRRRCVSRPLNLLPENEGV